MGAGLSPIIYRSTNVTSWGIGTLGPPEVARRMISEPNTNATHMTQWDMAKKRVSVLARNWTPSVHNLCFVPSGGRSFTFDWIKVNPVFKTHSFVTICGPVCFFQIAASNFVPADDRSHFVPCTCDARRPELASPCCGVLWVMRIAAMMRQ